MATIDEEGISDVRLVTDLSEVRAASPDMTDEQIDDHIFSRFEGHLGDEPAAKKEIKPALTEERVLQIMDTAQRVISNQIRMDIERYAVNLQKQLNREADKRRMLKAAFNEHVVHYRLLFRVVLDKLGPNKTQTKKPWFCWPFQKDKVVAPKLVVPPSKPKPVLAPRPAQPPQSVSAAGFDGLAAKEFGD